MKPDVIDHLGRFARNEVPPEQWERHRNFLKEYPNRVRKMNFCEGYLTIKMGWKMYLDLVKEVTLHRLRHESYIYSGRVYRFTFKVDRKLDRLTCYYGNAALHYLEDVLWREAVIFMILRLHLHLTYKTVNKYCSETEFSAEDVPGRGFLHEVDTEYSE